MKVVMVYVFMATINGDMNISVNLTNLLAKTHVSDYEEEVSSLTQFSPAMVVEACVRCLQIIDPDFSCPTTLPEVMSARYRMCTSLANACQVSSLHDDNSRA